MSDDTGPESRQLHHRQHRPGQPVRLRHHARIAPFRAGPTGPDAGCLSHHGHENTSARNGLKTGEGAGVGIFTGPPGAQNWGDVVVGNTLRVTLSPEWRYTPIPCFKS